MKTERNIILSAIQHYGATTQQIVCMEECAELTQCISKELRGKHDREHLIEEMADVVICLAMLKEMFYVTDEDLQYWIDKKQKRILTRMSDEVDE